MKKLSLFVLITLLSFLASSLLIVAPDEIVYLTYPPVSLHSYIAEPGAYLVDPWVDRTTIKIGYDKPTTTASNRPEKMSIG